ncbi:glycosyltransferase involved in cell wall biosynthesis [Parabacteroides sp. PFB2-12]|uniref:glycosyltransferase n=1 Tax=unclassified Parabacteroides TaxID=2649774 RepID=UPI002473528B|nr:MULTISPECIES: glycosyltransferase [unclassified Parabacteroides]MDH6343471.1 glycosyltransferase involved in cell wall biosynthesis [Parabacteroides sp. PM6-13]MDH6390929.1 glycosyltransferase involved in cell wall biosynthesis [Parabacteroides sp. PFB2-12]
MAKILIINKFYYQRGGDCTATLALEKLLMEKGHEVAIFSSRHPQNLPSKWEGYFPSEIDLSSPSFKNIFSALTRPFYPREVKRRFLQLIHDFQPDIIHAHNIHSYLSPYVVKLAAKEGIKVVWTLHDYKLICPAYTCLRDGKPCELCFTDKRYVIRHKCVKNSLSASIIAYLEAMVWNRKKLEKQTNTFISPSHFLKSKMVIAGYNVDKIEVLHNFIPTEKLQPYLQKGDYYCYVGRLSPEKGVDDLLKAAKNLSHPLYIIGSGSEAERLKKEYPQENIYFLGHQSPEKVIEMVQKARFMVIPSIWYENNPFSVIESLCVGTPVLGANIGGIPELIEVGKNGFLFTPGDIEELKQKITDCFQTFDDSYPFQDIADKARDKFSANTFYEQLCNIYGIQQ